MPLVVHKMPKLNPAQVIGFTHYVDNEHGAKKMISLQGYGQPTECKKRHNTSSGERVQQMENLNACTCPKRQETE